MANDVRSKVVLGIDVNEFRRGITQVDSSIKGISRQFQNLGGIIGASFAVGHIVQFGKEAVKMATEFEQVAQGFKRFGSEAELRDLRKATRGLVTDLELMKAAVTAGNFGIPVQELGRLLDFATRRAAETGQSVDYLVNSIVTGIGRKSPLILDNLGISAIRLKEKFGGAALEAQSIADVTRAVGDIASEELNKMGEPIDTAAEKLKRLQTAWDNFKTSVGAPIADEVANFLEKLSLTFLPGEQGGGLSQGIRSRTGNTGAFAKIKPRATVTPTAAPIVPPVKPTALLTISEIIQKQREKYEALNAEIYRLIGLQEQQAEGERQVFRDELVAGYTPLVLEAVDAMEGELVPILEKTKTEFDNVALVASQFGHILTSSFEAAISTGTDFFETMGNALKAYVQQLMAAVAATAALSVVSMAFGGGTFLQAFGKIGTSTGLASFFGGDQEFIGRVKGFELLLQQNRAGRNSGLINGN